MSTTVTVAEIKQNLRIAHDSDDDLLYRLIENAEDECRQFLNRSQLPLEDPDTNSPLESQSEPISDSSRLAASVRQAIYLLVEAGYDRLEAGDLQVFRQSAEVKLFPYRIGLGI